MQRLSLFFFCGLFITVNLLAQDDPDIDDSVQVLYNQGHYKKALTLAEESVAQRAQQGKDTFYSRSLNNLAVMYEEFGRYEEAEALYEEILDIDKRYYGTVNENYTISLANLGVLRQGLGDYEGALAVLKEAHHIEQKILSSDDAGHIYTLNALALSYEYLGRFREAELLYQEAIKIYEALPDKSEHNSSAQLNLAGLYVRMEQYAQAESILLAMRDFYTQEIGQDHPNFAIILNNLAVLYERQSRFEQAEALYKRVQMLDAVRYGTGHVDYAQAVSNLALLYSKTARYAEAEELHHTASKIYKKELGVYHPMYAYCMRDLGVLFHLQNQYTKGEAYFSQALDILQETLGATHPNTIHCQNLRGHLRLSAKRFKEAQADFETALRHNLDIEYIDWPKLNLQAAEKPTEVLHGLEGLHDVYLAYSEASGGSSHLRRCHLINTLALDYSAQLRNSFSQDEDKLRILAASAEWVGRGVASSLRIHPKGGATWRDAFRFVEQNKAMLLADALKAERAYSFGDLPDSLAHKERKLKQALKILQRDLLDYPDSEMTIRNDLAKTQQAIHQLKHVLEQNYPKYYKIHYQSIVAEVEEIQAILEPHTVLLEYFVSEDNVYVLRVTNNQLDVIPLVPSAKQLNAHIQVLRRTLSDYTTIQSQPEQNFKEFVREAHWFYTQLIPDLPNTTRELLIIPDGELGHLPFEVFLTDSVQATTPNFKKLPYLLQKYRIHYDYSATLFRENLQRKVQASSGQMLAMAASYNRFGIDSLRGQRHADYLRVRSGLQDLPAARREVEALSSQFQGAFLLGNTATEATFKAQAAQYDIVHLAMHGLLDTENPMLSSLAFTEDGDSIENNFLQAYEISSLDLSVGLVVLSACETGYGAFQRGEGVMSLARAFMYAGVPSLVVSLWQVSDASTAQIMAAFYTNIAKGQTKDEALRQAKLEYLAQSNGLGGHPAYWAPFIQLGSPKAMPLKRQGALPWTLIGWGSVGLAAVGALWWRRRPQKERA